mmetsp:Transcript_3605/g.5206  ORF Transcript_3605/g.5206 Transcript_3605/m.5206 type:complete len:92 (+) Transcript_3605:28-303(+)
MHWRAMLHLLMTCGRWAKIGGSKTVYSQQKMKMSNTVSVNGRKTSMMKGMSCDESFVWMTLLCSKKSQFQVKFRRHLCSNSCSCCDQFLCL